MGESELKFIFNDEQVDKILASYDKDDLMFIGQAAVLWRAFFNVGTTQERSKVFGMYPPRLTEVLDKIEAGYGPVELYKQNEEL